MSTNYSTEFLKSQMKAICALNREVQVARLPYKLWERHLSKCRCVLNTSTMEMPADSSDVEFESAHQKIHDYGLRQERDRLILKFRDHLMRMPCMHGDATTLVLVFGLTDAGNPAIEIRIDGMQMHDRPVTPPTLAPKLADLAACLHHNSEPDGPIRHFVISYTDRVAAVSPQQALWKWLCLRHRNTARRVMKLPVGSPLPSDEEFQKFIRGVSLYETFNTQAYLAGGFGLEPNSVMDPHFPTTPWPFPASG